MTVVVSFTGYTPPARYDATPWLSAQIEEAATEDGSYTLIDTVSLGTPDVDPSAPAARDFTTVLGTADDQWYRIIFVDTDSATSEPTAPAHNVSTGVIASVPYATAAELAAILKVNPTSNADALERVLLAAAGEIDAETGRNDLAGWEVALAAEVNLERATEHWQQMKSPFGIIGLGADLGATHTATDSWERHARKLAPLKRLWGLA